MSGRFIREDLASVRMWRERGEQGLLELESEVHLRKVDGGGEEHEGDVGDWKCCV